MTLRLHDSLTGDKREFDPLEPGVVKGGDQGKPVVIDAPESLSALVVRSRIPSNDSIRCRR